jgi:glycosyltransferase involved in cell wall biosynthesis
MRSRKHKETADEEASLRVDILANNKASYVRPMADSLERMLKRCGADPRVHYDGMERLMRRPSLNFSSPRSFAGSLVHLRSAKKDFSDFTKRLEGTDLIVVVAHTPTSFSPSVFPNVEELRRVFPRVPIVNHDLIYMPSMDSWVRAILRNEETNLAPENLKIFEHGKFGMERYDWYLISAVGGYMPLEDIEHPYSIIGLDIDDGRVYPGQKEFSVLVDFAQDRGEYPKYREIQLEALRIAGVKYEKLEGQYSRDEMLAVFRRSSVFLLAHAEAFGLPVCEAQACGCMIFAPDPHWVTAHWLSDEYTTKRALTLSPNFVIYENDPESLARELTKARDNFNPPQVLKTLEEIQPQMFRGDAVELGRFLEKVKSGAINSQSHQSYSMIGRKAS